MNPDNPEVADFMSRAMVARIATLSSRGRPSVNPLWFIRRKGHVWLGTSDWTLAARNVRANPDVVLLFDVESEPDSRRVLRIRGRAALRMAGNTGPLAYWLRVVYKYVLSPRRGLRHTRAHFRQMPMFFRYEKQGLEEGRGCVIDVTPEDAEFLQVPGASIVGKEIGGHT